jgi:hypothetical protein
MVDKGGRKRRPRGAVPAESTLLLNYAAHHDFGCAA